jgi:hypothetical protein
MWSFHQTLSGVRYPQLQRNKGIYNIMDKRRADHIQKYSAKSLWTM